MGSHAAMFGGPCGPDLYLPFETTMVGLIGNANQGLRVMWSGQVEQGELYATGDDDYLRHVSAEERAGVIADCHNKTFVAGVIHS